MCAKQAENEEEIYYGAISTPLEDRRDYIERACGEDTELRARIEALLKAREVKGDLLEAPVPGSRVTPEDPPISEALGTVIDKYKLLEQIGEGGMAVVYMAEQAEPIRRKVALKIIKLGMDTRQVIARFEAERQALAMMDHPNIARVLDAGATETGRPYFVMELVTGVSITEYCDKNSLSTKDRLALFIQVCNAVQHAHQKGIIHRDIKPSNVMVTRHEGTAVPKVIDFGIAKATNQRLTEKTLFTRYAHIIGTPAYMSPEQADMSDLDVDTRSDIYSLGVLLYELLTGTTPFSEEELRKAGYVEMQRVIREQEPPKPSTKLSTLGETLTDVAKYRASTPDLLTKAIRGDLDWIVMKSLEKDRTRRYDTPSALAQDVQRHLADEPVLARAPKVMYRLGKFLRRHKPQTVSALVIMALAAAVIVIFTRWNQDRRQLTAAEELKHGAILSQAREQYAGAEREAALETLAPILTSRHVGSYARLLQAGILVDSRRTDEATAVLNSLRNERPEIAGAAYSLLARAIYESQSLDAEKRAEIEEYRQRALELLPETAEAYFLQAMTAMTVKEQLASLDRALQLDPGHYESLRLRAFTHYASRKYDKMKDDALGMKYLRRGDPLGYSLRAIALRELGKHKEAIVEYDNAVALMTKADPQYVGLASQRCEVFLHMCDYDRVIAEAQDCMKSWPDKPVFQYCVFSALTANGEYEKADSVFQEIARRSHRSRNEFRNWCAKYVFDTLEAGRSWHPADREPAGAAFLPMVEAQETYRSLSPKAHRLTIDGFSACWSPDGNKIAFSAGVLGYSGIAVYDLATKKTELLIMPGKDPRWSPDCKYIAFVRDCQLLRVSEFIDAERKNQPPFFANEVWVMNANGTEPRRLTSGSWPFWSQDSKSVYYSSLGRLCVISTEKGETQGEVVLPSTSFFPSVSPDCRFATYVENTSLKIKELSSQMLLDECPLPTGIQGGQWSLSGKNVLLAGPIDAQSRVGLWIYNLELKQLRKLLRGPITCACWSPDETSVAFSLAPPLSEIWVADLEPNVPKTLTLGPDQVIERHYQDIIRHYTRVINADPNHALGYLKRARYYEYLGNSEQTTADVDKYISIVNPKADMNAHDRWFRDMLITLWQSTPINLGPPVNTARHDIGAVSPDGLSLFLESNRSPSHGSFDFWAATRPSVADQWSPPENLGSPINTKNYESVPTISADNLSLYFTSIDSPSGFGPAAICVSTRETTNAPWNPPRKLGSTINSARWQHVGSLSADGLELYLASNRPSLDWNSDYDIWVSRRTTRQDDWGAPVNIGPPVNSPYEDLAPVISPDGLMLFLTSERPGGCGSRDIWVSTRSTRESSWREPINLGPPINTLDWDQVAMMSTADSMLYFSSWRPGGYGLLDMYKVPIPKLSDYVSGSSEE